MSILKNTFLLLLTFIVASQATYVAVLETVADVGVKKKVSLTDRQYLTNVLREQAVKELPASQNFTIMTRENIREMLPPDKSIEDCEGSCIVETGKNIAADYICQARVSSFNGSLTLSAELYETAGNKLIASFNGLGPNLSTLLTLIIQKSPEFFHNVKKDLGMTAPVNEPDKKAVQTSNSNSEMSNTATEYTTQNPPPTQNAAPNAGYEYYAPTAKSNTTKEMPWRKAGFFLHAGYLNAGLGVKVRISRENGIYMTADTRFVSYKDTNYGLIPVMIYLGGNVVHFTTGMALWFTSRSEDKDDLTLMFPLGLNCDFGRHFGIDGLMFFPVAASSSPIFTLDFRFVF